MAGEWLKFDSSLPDKPETLAITVTMGWDDPDLTVGKLMRLFRWFDQHTVDGNASGVTPALLDRLIGVTGFVHAVAKAGWICVTDDGLRLQNFEKHNGTSAKKRAQTASRVANHRSQINEIESGNAHVVTRALAREEKRREEKNKDKTPSPLAGRFAEFWSIWPKNERKQDKTRCAKRWKDKALDAVADRILADVALKTQTQKWRGGFVEAPLVYLNNERWLDEVTPEVGGGAAFDFDQIAREIEERDRQDAQHRLAPAH